MAIVTLAEAKSHLRIGSTTALDAYIQKLIDSCEAWISDYCGVAFAEVTVTDELVDGGELLLRPVVLPVSAVTSIKDAEEDDEVVTATDYVVTRRGAKLKTRQRWEDGLQRWKVTYTGGYDTVPSGLFQCVLQMIYRAYHDKGGQETEQSSNVWVKWDSFVDQENLSLLNLYRIGPFA